MLLFVWTTPNSTGIMLGFLRKGNLPIYLLSRTTSLSNSGITEHGHSNEISLIDRGSSDNSRQQSRERAFDGSVANLAVYDPEAGNKLRAEIQEGLRNNDRYIPAVSGLLVDLKSELRDWRKIGVKMFGIGWDIVGLHEQNRVLVIGTKVPFYS